MTLSHLFLIHRYKIDSVHFVTPTEDNHRQVERMKERGIFTTVAKEVGQIIVAEVNKDRVTQLLAPDRIALTTLIEKG
jgi:isocitrate lyase